MPPAYVMVVWPHLQRAFRKAQGVGCGDRMDEVEILRALCEGSMELIVAMRFKIPAGGVILEYADRPKGRCCFVVCSLFNDFSHRFPEGSSRMNDHLIDHAKRHGCYVIESNARDGVIMDLRELGWRRKATVMEVKL